MRKGVAVARILVAEDDPHAREMIVRICEFQGHEVEEARDGVRALEAFQRTLPDLVITDLAMPLGSGEQLVRQVREQRRDCPIIIITGYAAALGPTDLKALEGCTILQKPIDVEPMLRALNEALTPA
jgi:two-component system, NtrC family, response regulator AtoC